MNFFMYESFVLVTLKSKRVKGGLSPREISGRGQKHCLNRTQGTLRRTCRTNPSYERRDGYQ